MKLKCMICLCLWSGVVNGAEQVELVNFGSKGLVVFDDAEIAFGYAECYQHPFGGGDVGVFKIPKDDLLKLVARFRNSKIDPTPETRMAEICSIRLVSNDGRSQRISIFWWYAKCPKIYFSLNGVRCICLEELCKPNGQPLDHAMSLDGRIRALHQDRAETETGKQPTTKKSVQK